MRRIPIAIAGACFLGCTITVTPLPQPKKSRPKQKHSAVATKKPTPAPNRKNIKETWWIENYHKLEAAHGNYTIPDDTEIEPLPDGRFRVPNSVLTHYQDLLLTTPSPAP